jgi:uncharacterized protein (DUF58 family)
VLTGASVSIDDLLALRHKHHVFKPSQASKVVGNRAGIKLSKIKGRGVDFSEVRPYQPGDDIRAIDWRVTARKNKPHTKIFREERERPTLVVVDQSQNMYFGSKVRLKSVAAAELAARIAWQNLQAGDRVGGIVIGNTSQSVFRPFRTSKAVARFLYSVAQYNQNLSLEQINPAASITEGLLRVRRLTHTNYRIFVLSDFVGDLRMWQNNLHQLARHNQVVVVHICDPLEAELPPADHYAITDGAERLQLYTGDSSLRLRYREKFNARCSELASLCAHDAMNYLRIETSNDHLDQYNWV